MFLALSRAPGVFPQTRDSTLLCSIGENGPNDPAPERVDAAGNPSTGQQVD
jgi:hypothetical protein